MKRGAVAVTLGLLVVAFGSAVSGQAANANGTRFASCAAMNEVLPSGLAQSNSAASKARAAGYARPQVNKALFAQVRKDSPRLRPALRGVLCPVTLVVEPPGSVTDLVATSVKRDSLSLLWRPPPIRQGDRIDAYVVAGQGDISVSGTRATVTALMPGTTYEFQVSAVNASGAGPAVSVTVETLPPPVRFLVPPLWEDAQYSWAPPGSTYLRFTGSAGTVLSLSNASQLLGRLSGGVCSRSWYESASAWIEFLDAAGNPVTRNAVVNGRPDLTKPVPDHPFGPSRELVGYFPSTSDFDSYGCETDNIDLAEWQRAKQIRVDSVRAPSGQVYLGLSVRDEE